MKSRLLYVELKSGYSDNGPAWIGKGQYSKTGKTIYFNGQAFGKAHGISGNYFDGQNEYWISGIKKTDTNRHWAGSGIIFIDESVVNEYLGIRGLDTLPKSAFKVVKLDNEPIKDLLFSEQNEPLRRESDE